MNISIRSYTPNDYQHLKLLYEKTGWFDPETDSGEKLNKQIQHDPDGIFLAIEEDNIIGSITIFPTGRLGLLFRLVTIDRPDSSTIRMTLLHKGEAILKEKGYNEAHIIAPEEDTERQKEYESYGFQKGKTYQWFWKQT